MDLLRINIKYCSNLVCFLKQPSSSLSQDGTLSKLKGSENRKVPWDNRVHSQSCSVLKSNRLKERQAVRFSQAFTNVELR